MEVRNELIIKTIAAIRVQMRKNVAEDNLRVDACEAIFLSITDGLLLIDCGKQITDELLMCLRSVFLPKIDLS